MDDFEVMKALRDWTIADANDEQLLEILRHLCRQGVAVENIGHRDLLRGAAINHIQMARILQRLEGTLKRHEIALKSLEADSRWIRVFAIVTGVLTLVLVVLTSVLAEFPLQDL